MILPKIFFANTPVKRTLDIKRSIPYPGIFIPTYELTCNDSGSNNKNLSPILKNKRRKNIVISAGTHINKPVTKYFRIILITSKPSHHLNRHSTYLLSIHYIFSSCIGKYHAPIHAYQTICKILLTGKPSITSYILTLNESYNISKHLWLQLKPYKYSLLRRWFPDMI